jgi:HAD superfamily hydrolase (TIGR01490 family)
MTRYIAFFDLDHTMLDTSSGRLFIKYAYRHGVISHRELLSGIAISMMHRFGLLNSVEIFDKWAIKFAGWPEIKMRDFTERFFIESAVQHVRPEIGKEIDFHRERGALTVILSASMIYMCEPLRRHLSMDDCLCTALEVQNGLFTGMVNGKYCYGQEKLIRAQALCTSMDIPIDDCYYYADSPADLPVLDKVGTPVCVSPGYALRRTARRRRWRIIP